MKRARVEIHSRPSYPEYEAEFGEDPARFIHHMNPIPRIRAIDNEGLLCAYLDVETDRDEPRKRVVAALDERLREVRSQRPTPSISSGAVATDGGEPR